MGQGSAAQHSPQPLQGRPVGGLGGAAGWIRMTRAPWALGMSRRVWVTRNRICPANSGVSGAQLRTKCPRLAVIESRTFEVPVLPVPLPKRYVKQGGSLVRQPVKPGPRKVDQPIRVPADPVRKVSER